MLAWLKHQWRQPTPENAFLLLSVIFGALFVFVVPPTQAADETTHFYRAYQLSRGQVLSTKIESGYGALLPRDIQTVSKQLFADIPGHHDRLFNYHQLLALLGRRINRQDLVAVHLEGSTVYSPVPYVPQILAIEFAKVVWPSTLLMYYLARLANLATWIAISYAAIRFWPHNKWPFFALALTPMSLSQAASVSPDALTNSLAFLTISGAFYVANRRASPTKQEMWLGLGLLGLLALCKPVFFVLGALAFIPSIRHLRTKQRYRLFAGGCILVAVAMTAGWNALISNYSTAIQHYYYPAQNVDKVRQAAHMVGHPLGFAYTLGRTYASSIGDLFTKTFIGRLGWWDIDLPLWLVFGIYLLIILAIINTEPGEKWFTMRQRCIAGIIFVSGVVAISATLYLTLTPVGAHYIVGMQGRYFIPFSILLIPALGGVLKVENWNVIAARLYPLAYCFILATSLIVLVSRFI